LRSDFGLATSEIRLESSKSRAVGSCLDLITVADRRVSVLVDRSPKGIAVSVLSQTRIALERIEFGLPPRGVHILVAQDAIGRPSREN
jgi:hypothetical protein